MPEVPSSSAMQGAIEFVLECHFESKDLVAYPSGKCRHPLTGTPQNISYALREYHHPNIEGPMPEKKKL